MVGPDATEIEERFPEGWARHEAGGDGWEHGETHAAMSGRIVSAVMWIAEGLTPANASCACSTEA